jgi:hypothetical protein
VLEQLDALARANRLPRLRRDPTGKVKQKQDRRRRRRRSAGREAAGERASLFGGA